MISQSFFILLFILYLVKTGSILFSHFLLNTKKNIILKLSRIYGCYNLCTCGEYNSSLKKCISMVRPIFKCLVKKNFSYSKTIILTEIFIIIHILSLSNKALKYFLNYTKTFKNNVTSNAYSLWPTDTISISWECLEVDKAGVQFWKVFAISGFF